jgi:hypothetical protein
MAESDDRHEHRDQREGDEETDERGRSADEEARDQDELSWNQDREPDPNDVREATIDRQIDGMRVTGPEVMKRPDSRGR